MKSRSEFCMEIGKLNLTHPMRAIALLWYYRQSQEYEERSASELALDLHDEGYPKPHVTNLKKALKKSKYVINGKRKGTFQLDVRRINELDVDYKNILNIKEVKVSDAVLPTDMVKGTRQYLEKMVYQINGTYDSGFYDSCAVICRRLMESLIIEIYIYKKRQSEIQKNGVFFYLDSLVKFVTNDKSLNLSRNTPKTMNDIKQIGDTAAHDRVYITKQEDINDIKLKYRRMISDLLVSSGIQK